MTNPYEGEPGSRYLPVVTQQAVSNVGTEIGRYGWPTFRLSSLFGLERSNPNLRDGVKDFLTESGMAVTASEFDASSAAMIVTHQILAEQARLDDSDQDPSRYRLPVVQPGIVDAYKADIHERGAVAVGIETMDKLAAENGHLESMTALFLRGSRMQGQALSAAHAAVQMTYALLDRQAAADAMNDGVFGSTPES